MTGIVAELSAESAIDASWQRCEQQHKLTRDAARPILRLQTSEVAPRLEKMVERTGGRQGIFRQLADIVTGAGHCLVVTDADGILVRLEGKDADHSKFEWNGIALGSCWDERIAGTNGVAMVLSEGKAFTVQGKDHYFSMLSPFACTAVPLFDAENQTIGVANIATVDRGNTADYSFSKQLLGAAAERIQRFLFEQRFGDTTIVSVSQLGQRDLLRSDELVAVNESGTILGSTTMAHQLVGMENPSDLNGRPFDSVFGAEASTLDRVPERVLSIRAENGPALKLWTRLPDQGAITGRGWAPSSIDQNKPLRRRIAPSMRELAVGSDKMATLCLKAETLFQRALPFVIEGETGTGKSALVAVVRDAAKVAAEQVVTVECAMLDDHFEDRKYLRTLLEKARVVDSLDDTDRQVSTLVFENIDEMPSYAQAGLRSLLAEFEAIDSPAAAGRRSSGLRIVATSDSSLGDKVQCGRFRSDLYYLLAGASIELLPLRQRERLDVFALACAEKIAGTEVEISAEALDMIVAHDWPGNVRELRSVLQQALLGGDGRRISPVDLMETSLFARSASGRLVKPEGAKPLSRIAYDEKSMLLDALTGARWNVSQAARNLGIGRATIHRKMKHHGISRPN